MFEVLYISDIIDYTIDDSKKKYYNSYEEIENKDDIDVMYIKDLKNESLLIDEKNIKDLRVKNCKNCSFTFKNFKEGMVVNFENCSLNSVYLENINTGNEEDYCDTSFVNCTVYSLTIKKGVHGFLFEDSTVEKIIFENVTIWLKNNRTINVSFEGNINNLIQIDSESSRISNPPTYENYRDFS